MTAPTLSQKKFYIIKPAEGTNQIKNPRFDPPDFEEDWAVGSSSGSATIEETSDEQRFGAYCMKITPNPGDTYTFVKYNNVSITNGDSYTFSAYVKGTDGDSWQVGIYNGSDVSVASTTFVTTGYWQRVEVTHAGAENASNYEVRVSTATADNPIYVDGAQFEQASAASTLIHGYGAGCRWTGLARNSSSYRPATTAAGGEIVDLEDYCHIVQVTGLGHGDWNQIMTKMTSGGDMYQTHIRKSRNFSIVVDFLGSSLGEIETNRAAVIDLIRPDLLPGQERIVRYQGIDVNGVEATNPVDIVCVPLPATLTDTPDLPSYQRAVLNFSIPSGLLNGAYNEGAELDLYADFPAEFIVKRDPNGNWCKWGGAAYESLITGLAGVVYCMAEGPDGKIYVGGSFTNAGGVTDADRLARWNPTSEAWESVISGISSTVQCMAFDANGDLYIGGSFQDLGSANGDKIAKITGLEPDGTPTANALGTGLAVLPCEALAISPNGDVYAGGQFISAGGVANTAYIAKWDGTAWSALSTGLNNNVFALAFAPNGDLYIGGMFTDVAYPYLCKWNGTAFSVVGTNTDINKYVRALAFGATGHLYVGGAFTNAGGNPNADYIAKWSGSSWESLGTGMNSGVTHITVNSGKVYAGGVFTTADGLTVTDRVAVWSNGAWQPIDIDFPGTSQVLFVLPASDGSLYVGGVFSTAGETPDENAETGIVALNLEVSSASANTYPYIQVYGPGTLKAITNYSTGKTIAFDGLTLNAGEWINLYFDPLNLKFTGGWSGRGNLMRYVVPGSDYGDFYLMPGENLISIFYPDSDPSSGSHAWIQWTPLFWGLDGAVLE